MSITDELRLWAARELASWKMARERYDDLIAIAELIDADHKKAVERARMDGMDATFGNGWVKLPTDADGVPIHVGDMVGWDGDEEFEVKGFGGSRAERLFYLNESGRFCWGIADNCHHVQPDSWERIMDDAEKLARGDNAAVMELVERCRRLAGEDA